MNLRSFALSLPFASALCLYISPLFLLCFYSAFFNVFLLPFFRKDLTMDRIEAKFPQNPPLKAQKIVLGAQICLRILAIASTLAATWVMLTSKQSTEIIGITFYARYSYSSIFKFFAFANAVACAFSVLSLLFVFFLCRPGPNSANYYYLFLHDLFLMSLVLAGCAAATAEGYIGRYGNGHAGWSPICDHFGKFCNKMTSSVILSYLAVSFLLMLTILSASKSRQIQV